MIEILQENGELVTAVGTALRAENRPCFLQADLVVAVQSRVLGKSSTSLDKMRFVALGNPSDIDHPSMPAIIQAELSSTFNAINASLILESDASLAIVADLIGEARTMVLNYRQVLMVFVAGHLVIAGMATFSYLFATPNILTYYYIAWLAWVQLPLLAMPLIASRPGANLMAELPSKNDSNHRKNLALSAKRHLWYSIFRLFPTCIVLVVCFMWKLAERCDQPSQVWNLFLWQTLYAKSVDVQGACLNMDNVLSAQMLTLFSFVWFFIFIAATYSTRHASLAKEPLYNPFWYFAAGCALLLQVAYNEAFLASNMGGNNTHLRWLSSAPPYFWLVFVFWPVVILLSSELLKIEERKFFNRTQARLRIVYDTRLGMYSPK
jgi:magnesium-transporting ATPase (P-type)